MYHSVPFLDELCEVPSYELSDTACNTKSNARMKMRSLFIDFFFLKGRITEVGGEDRRREERERSSITIYSLNSHNGWG